ncbi:MAG: tetratricopeptide repeat protein, partial [Victivallales bacterium]
REGLKEAKDYVEKLVCEHKSELEYDKEKLSLHCSICGRAFMSDEPVAALSNDDGSPGSPCCIDCLKKEAMAPTQASNLDAELLKLLREDRKITAIKLRRDRLSEGLGEAKKYVEKLAYKHGLVPETTVDKPGEVPQKTKKYTDSNAGLCDICNCELDSQRKTIVKTDIIREATANGYLPPVAKSMNSELLQFGMSGKDMWEDTIEAGSATNWALCSECYKEITKYAQPDDSTASTPESKESAMELKECTQCGAQVETLRHSCPKCGSTMFSIDQDEASSILDKQAKAAELVTQGERLIQAGKFEKAKQTLHQAIKINPYNETAYGNLGGVFYFQGKYAEAIPWMEKALEINPHIAGIPEALQNARAKADSDADITRKAPDYKTADTHINERNPLWNSYVIILFLMLLSCGIYQYFWLYRVFKELYARKTTNLSPGRAVGYMFIPLFNLVWIFIVWKKLGDAIVRAYAQAGLVKPVTGIVWIPPISYWLVIVFYAISPTAGAVNIIFFFVLLSAILCRINKQMNRLTGEHSHEDLEHPGMTENRRSRLKPECKVKQRAIVLGHGYRELAAALGTSGSPVVSGETVMDIKQQMPEICPHCGGNHNCIWVIGFCGFQVPGREGRASSETEIKKWGDRYLDLFRERGGRELLKDQGKKDMLEWFWDTSASSGSLVIKCSPGGNTSWLYELLALMEQTAVELSGKNAASNSKGKNINAEKHSEQPEVKQKNAPPSEPASHLGEALLSNNREQAAEAAREWSALREDNPELAAQLMPAASEAAEKALETLRKLLKNGKTVGENEAFQLASFGDAASSYAPVLQKQMEEAGEPAMQNPWLIGALACMVSDPKPYFSTLLESMRNADEGRVESPLLRVQVDGSVQMAREVRDVYSGDLGSALGYISAWGANKPAANSQDSMLHALS